MEWRWFLEVKPGGKRQRAGAGGEDSFKYGSTKNPGRLIPRRYKQKDIQKEDDPTDPRATDKWVRDGLEDAKPIWTENPQFFCFQGL